MVNFKNYTAQQLEASLDVIERIQQAESPLLECVEMSTEILVELFGRLNEMEAHLHE